MASIAELIATDIIEGRPFRPLDDPDARPEIGYAAQFDVAAILATAKGGVAGRKIAWNTAEAMEKFGVKTPAAGHVFSDDLCRGDANLRLDDYSDFMMEPELAAVLAVDLAPRAGGWDRESAADAVSHITVAFELLDRREASSNHAASLIANNIFNAGLCYDTENGVKPRDLDPSSLVTVVEHDEQEILRKTGAAPQHPLDAVAFLANHFNAHGVTPKAGEVLLCGAHMPLYPVEHPGRFRMRVDGVGEVSFRLS
ncbi:hypothetical protein [Pikeienuella sp. HZG-20]|uniref:2-keto-4-pentenoate hydratase n=1 Tax=Paludibacillus litoralis TaxID=3133267 RepID=UPI0030EEAD03